MAPPVPHSEPRRPRRVSGRWYAIGAVIALLGLVGALVLGLASAGLARDAKVTRLSGDGAMTVPDHRFAVWVDAGVPSGSTGEDLGVTCVLTPQGGPTIDVPTLRNQSATATGWHLVALSADGSTRDWVGTPATLSCRSTDPELAQAAWGTGKQPQILGVLALAVGALVVGTGGVVLGVLVALLVWFLQRRARQRSAPA